MPSTGADASGFEAEPGGSQRHRNSLSHRRGIASRLNGPASRRSLSRPPWQKQGRRVVVKTETAFDLAFPAGQRQFFSVGLTGFEPTTLVRRRGQRQICRGFPKPALTWADTSL